MFVVVDEAVIRQLGQTEATEISRSAAVDRLSLTLRVYP
jgi:hypothetical protein